MKSFAAGAIPEIVIKQIQAQYLNMKLTLSFSLFNLLFVGTPNLVEAGRKKKESASKDDCRDVTRYLTQSWNDSPLIKADGTAVATSDYTSAGLGGLWSFKGPIYDVEGNRVGVNYETSSPVDNEADIWMDVGYYILDGCDGILNFQGIYTDKGTIPGLGQYEAEFVITGGTGDFLGAVGSITTVYDAEANVSERIVTIY